MALDINLNGVEATANKSTNVNTDQASNTKYPSVKAVYDWAVGLFARATRTISTTSPLSGGGDLSADRTLTISQSNTTTNGYLSSTDWNTFNNKLSTSTAGTTYVPYTGATSDVDLGTKEITSAKLHSYGGATVGGNSTGYSNGFIDFFNSTNSFFTRLKAGVNTQSTTITLPLSNGTIGQNLSLTSTDQLGWTTPANGSVTSVGLSMPSAFSVSNSPITSSGSISVSGAGTAAQYVRGDGQLATFPATGGGGSSINYYLNGSIASSVAGYQQLDNNPIIGVGTDFNLVGNGLIAQFLTNVSNPNRLEIPAGAWNFEVYFSMSSVGGAQKFYIDLLKYNGSIFTLIASTSANPEAITSGITTDLYVTSMAVPLTTLLATDRLALRIYIVDNSGARTTTLHTEDNHLCQIITTFSGGISSLNGLTANTQYLATGTSGTDFAISSTTDTHTFNLPTANGTKRGALSSADWTTFNGKESALTFSTPLSRTTNTISIPAATTSVNGYLSSTDWSTFNGKQNTISLTTTGTSGAATLVGSTLNVPQYAGGLTYFTEAQNSAAPNATVKVDSITATASTTNADVAIVPKGTGAFTLAVPDNLVAGGNKRGANAVDLQTARTANTQVASGANSSILGGYLNTAGGAYSVAAGYANSASGATSVAIGSSNSASGTVSYTFGNSCTASNTYAIAMGSRATASGQNSICIGNYDYANSVASGGYSVVIGYGTASGARSMAIGFQALSAGTNSSAIGDSSNTFSTIGRIAFGGSTLLNSGDIQKGIISYRQRTTDATATILTTNNATSINDNAGSQFALQNNQVVRYKGSITAKKSGTTDVAIWDIDGVIVRGANAASTTLPVSNINLVTNIPGWVTPVVEANTSVNVGGLKITITGVAATNIQWFATLDTVENIYA